MFSCEFCKNFKNLFLQNTYGDCFNNHNKSLTHFTPLVSFYTPENIRKPVFFLMFSGGIDREQNNFRHEWVPKNLKNFTT